MAGREAVKTELAGRSKEPRFVQELVDLIPGVIRQQEVVALGDDQGHMRVDRDRRTDRLLEITPILRREDDAVEGGVWG